MKKVMSLILVLMLTVSLLPVLVRAEVNTVLTADGTAVMEKVEVKGEGESVFSNGELGTGTPDGEPPVLKSFWISSAEAEAPCTLEIIVEATDDISGIMEGTVELFCEETQEHLTAHVRRTYYDEETWEKVEYPDGKLHGELKIGQYIESGSFLLARISLRDVAGNWIAYSGEYTWLPDPADNDAELPDDLKELQIHVTSDTPDSTPPEVYSLSISETEITAPARVEVIADASDDVSGISFLGVSFWCKEQGEAGSLSCTLSNTYLDEESGERLPYSDGKYHGLLEIDQYATSGVFLLNTISVWDVAENLRRYTRSDDTLPGDAGTIELKVVESSESDGSYPVMHSLTFSSTHVTAPGSLEVIMEASDEGSGIGYAEIGFVCKETNKASKCTLSNKYWVSGEGYVPYPDGKFRGILEIDQYMESGRFSLIYVSLSDEAGNTTWYDIGATSTDTPYYCAMPDNVKGLYYMVFNTVPDVTTSVDDPSFLEELQSMDNNAYMIADYSGNATLTEEAFEAIAGTNKTLDLTSDGITWRFNGNDITEEIKPIDLKVDITTVEDEDSVSGEAIAEELKANPGVVMKFPKNGTLPGKATIQVKVDYTMREYLGTDQQLCVYYYNNETGKLELIAEELKVVNDTYVEFSITHCSYYVLTTKLPEEDGCAYAYGDVNHDGQINAKDATLILQESVGVLKSNMTFCERCADVSGEGSINAKDSTLILQFSVSLRDKFPVEG